MTGNLSASDREQLARLPLFADLSPRAMERMLDAACARRWVPTEPVIREGDDSRELFIVLNGSAQVTVRTGGRDLVLAELGPGDVFGEEGLLSGTVRAATVTARTELRCAILPASALDAPLAAATALRTGLEELSAQRLHDRLVRSVTALQGLERAGLHRGDVRRVSFSPGEVILKQDDASDAVYFVLDGVVLALREEPRGPVTLTRVGAGQCVGEIGVMNRAARSASVVAETHVVTLRVDADRFRAWVASNPRLADYLGTLERIYPLADGRLLSVYRGQHKGREAVTTLAGDPAADCIMSTKVTGEDIVVLARGSATAGPDREIVRYERLADGRARELVLHCLERGSSGEVLSARIDGVEVHGIDLDVPRLYHALRNGEVIQRREIQRLRRTGFLGGQTPAADPNRICACLGIGKREVLSAANEHGSDLETISAMLGLGTVCGACLPRAAAEIGRAAPLRVSVPPIPRLPRQVKSKLIVRRPHIEYDVGALQQLTAEPELHAVAVASVFATIGERFMVQRVGAALPTLADPVLAADVEVFLEQERQHIAAHEPFNRLLLDRMYPDSRALHRCAHGMIGGPERVSPTVGLALSAFFEHVADCTFAAFLEEYYGRNRRYSVDPGVHDLVDRAGVGSLFIWHAGEEMSHRHIAFDVMRAVGAGWFVRASAMGLLGMQAMLLFIPALAALHVSTSRQRRARASRPLGSTLRLTLSVIVRGMRFLLPAFHPGKERYSFLPELAQDLERFPEA
jgi:CRP-like cAMP-binding protein/predicted metal-dependent hydrolase/bacterioferritin-associated ferredoxin